MADGSPWTDTLDDTSNVYIPPGGLVGVEVSGGDAHLLGGEDEGWIASSEITCPEGYRYDLVLIEVDTPGDSWVNITILDPSLAPGDAAYANATVPGYVDLPGTDVSVFRVSVATYPSLRIQVTLHASGTDRPRLLAWSLYFIDLGQWRDEFLGTGKMQRASGIDVTSGEVGLDLSGAPAGEDMAYPPVLFPDARGDVDIFLANANQDGYLDDATIVNTKSTRGMDAGDLDGDGYVDIVLARDSSSGSLILWGSDTGRWTASDSMALTHTDDGTDVAIGDFNGDGHNDFVISAIGGMMHDGSYVWLNDGAGTFGKSPDIKLDGGCGHVDAGDLNDDGYDDIVLTKSLVMDAPCYFGGPSGPDNTADINFLRGITMTAINQVLIEDVDQDGNLDVLFAVFDNSKVPIYLGSSSGPDNTADYNLDVNSIPWDMSVGDLNDDGYLDLVYVTGDAGMRNGRIEIFKGASSGWSALAKQTIIMGPDPNNVEVVDVDLDGYDDILCGESSTFKVFMGGTAWPSAVDISKSGLTAPTDMAVAPSAGAAPAFEGDLVTEPIPRPASMLWDVLYLDSDVPGGTDASITVLDGTGEAIPGYEDLAGPAVDLRGIGQWGTIQVRIEMSSTSNTSTPTLRSLTVNWQPDGQWRDQFYGDLKAESMLNLAEKDLSLASQMRSSDLPDLLFASLRSDLAYDTQSMAFMDAGGMKYLSIPPLVFNTKGATAVDTYDVNGDGLLDLAFSSYGTGPNSPDGSSWVFLGSPAGWYDAPYHTFSTTAATDILMDDLNGDGDADVVITQDLRFGQPRPSLLFLGGEDGWSDTPDVEFNTSGCQAVEAADMDGDGLTDLVFACEGTDSLLFYQESAGFCGTVPSHRFSTMGAKAVAVGDLDDDDNPDLAFANYYDGDSFLIDSHVYWGQTGRGFKATPDELPTKGATDVTIADLEGDGDLDVVFANYRNETGGYESDAGIYINDGSGGLTTSMMFFVPTNGAYAVAAVDMDGEGILDLVFACRANGTGYRIPSVAFVTPWGGWPFAPTMELPTVGAVDVLPVSLSDPDMGGYVSEAITPDPAADPGAYHILSYVCNKPAGQTGTLSLLDADTGEVLAQTAIQSGENEWDLTTLVSYRAHPSVRVMVSVNQLEANPGFTIDDLFLNWTPRMPAAPQVREVTLSDTTVYRGGNVLLTVDVTDEYDLPGDLELTVEHLLTGESTWRTYLLGDMTFEDGSWKVTLAPDRFVATGVYSFRVNVTDSDGLFSGFVYLGDTLEVLANLPEAPNLLRATPDDGEVELEWRAPLDTGDHPLDGFRIFRGTDPEELAVIKTVEAFVDSHVDPGLTNGVTYYYAVVAYNDLGDSPRSPVLNATPLGVPDVPLDLSVTPGDGQVTVEWSAPAMDGGSAILGYRVLRGVYDGPLEVLASVGVVTEYLDEGLTNGQEYSYTVLAFNELGDGPQAVALPVVPMGLPDAPTGLEVDVGTLTLTITWESPLNNGGSALTGFKIYKGSSADGLELLEAMPASARQFVDDDLVAGETYYYAVAAETAAGEGARCPAVSAVAIDVPGAPGDLVADPGDGQVVLTWTAPFDGGSAMTGYVVVRTSGGDTEEFETGVVTTYTDTEVTNGETYSYQVLATNELGRGASSTSVEASPFKPVFVPGKVSSLAATAKRSRVTLTWMAPDDDGGSPLTGYVILRGESADSMTEIALVGLSTSYLDEDVKEGTTYHYTVLAVNAVGQGDPVDSVQVKVPKAEVDEDEFPTLLMVGIVVVLAAIVLGRVVMPRLKKQV